MAGASYGRGADGERRADYRRGSWLRFPTGVGRIGAVGLVGGGLEGRESVVRVVKCHAFGVADKGFQTEVHPGMIPRIGKWPVW